MGNWRKQVDHLSLIVYKSKESYRQCFWIHKFNMQRQFGLLRSLITYYGNPLNSRRLRRLYGQFLGPGDLYFDVGAHVGNRVRIAANLGAHVIALEPNPTLEAFLQSWYGENNSVSILQKGIAGHNGSATLYISDQTPTVSSFSESWIATVRQHPSFKHIQWQSKMQIELTTLDELIDTFGVPTFCKIDVEGFELEALQGLSIALPALSFEYIPLAIDLALQCIHKLEGLASYEYNWTVAEKFLLGSVNWLDAEEIAKLLISELSQGTSGDIYARRKR